MILEALREHINFVDSIFYQYVQLLAGFRDFGKGTLSESVHCRFIVDKEVVFQIFDKVLAVLEGQKEAIEQVLADLKVQIAKKRAGQARPVT